MTIHQCDLCGKDIGSPDDVVKVGYHSYGFLASEFCIDCVKPVVQFLKRIEKKLGIESGVWYPLPLNDRSAGIPSPTMASTEDVHALDRKVQALDTKVTAEFERIDHLLMEEQRRNIENLETRMKTLEDALPAGRPRRLAYSSASKAAREWRRCVVFVCALPSRWRPTDGLA
jgi:hypothetical protein